MAIINLKGMGRISGRVGNIVFRTRYGKTYISARPCSYNSPKTTEATGRRLRFKTTGKLASCINRDEMLKRIWTQKGLNMTGYNAIFKNLHDYVSNDEVGEINIFPDYGFDIKPRIDNNKERLRVSINVSDQMETGGIKGTDKYIKMVTIFYCVDYFESNDAFFLNVTDTQEIQENKEMVFEISYNIDETKLNKIDYQNMERCEKRNIFTAFALLDEKYEFVKNTLTYNLNGYKSK
jgi:hypothetical protein